MAATYKNETINDLRKKKNFVFFTQLPHTGDPGRDRALLKLNFENHLERYFSNARKPKRIERTGPESL